MKNSFDKFPPQAKTNYIDPFPACILLECIDPNKQSKSNEKNYYSVFSTKEHGPVSIMSGELEELHFRVGKVLTTLDGKDITKSMPNGEKTKMIVSDKALIGRGKDGKIFKLPNS